MSMKYHRQTFVTAVTAALVLAFAGPGSAEIIVFTTGRTMSVERCRVEGDLLTVTLPGGGEATFARSLVARIAPDEVPRTEEEPAPAAAGLVGADGLDSRPFAELIASVADRHGLDPALVHAVVETESNYHPTARSEVGARGLMQVMPATGRELGVRSASRLFDPQANVEAGVKYLKLLLERFDGNLTNALAAYNAGPAAVLRYGGVPPFRETQDYVRKVLARLQP